MSEYIFNCVLYNIKTIRGFINCFNKTTNNSSQILSNFFFLFKPINWHNKKKQPVQNTLHTSREETYIKVIVFGLSI